MKSNEPTPSNSGHIMVSIKPGTEQRPVNAATSSAFVSVATGSSLGQSRDRDTKGIMTTSCSIFTRTAQERSRNTGFGLMAAVGTLSG
jgi:hypothetical protein